MEREEVIIKTTRKAVKNPFARVHQAAVESGGNLSDETRKRMMKEAIYELRNMANKNNGEYDDI